MFTKVLQQMISASQTKRFDTTLMADVRSLLRNERAQRRINHPHASYSATGTLECSVCHLPLKSDVEVWEKHLKSPQHAMRQERLRLSTSQRPRSTNLPERADQASSREVSAGSKKRKADDDDDDSRKRTRPVVDVPRDFFDEQTETEKMSSKPVVEEANLANGRGDAVTKSPQGSVRANGDAPILSSNPPTNLPIQSPTAPIDEDEWAAFERDVATPPPDPFAPSALTASASISAAPMTAAELAAQSREQASLQARENREAEVEGEKEDAARALEEEFDEMEQLEERVRRLREKREELRRKRVNEAEEDEKTEIDRTPSADLEESEGSEDEDDGWSLWKG